LTKKILLYGINFSPELTGIGKYTGEMAVWLAARGHQVRVVTAPPYYPAWQVGDGFKNTWCMENLSGHGGDGSVRVWRCPLWVPARPGGIKRLLHLASFALSSWFVMLRQIFWRPDVVWVVEPALFCAPTAVAVARLSGARAWLHVQDFEVDAAFDLGLLKGQHMRNWVGGVERWLMRRFDVVSTISQRMHARLLHKGVDSSRAVLVPNWVQVAALASATAAQCAAMRQRLGVPTNAVLALYSGNMGAKQGLEILADVAKQLLAQLDYALEAPEGIALWFVFCGAGPGRAMLEAACAGLPQVRFSDLQPAKDLPALLACADIHLLPQRADAADLVMPSKLTGMLASARPVVATAHMGTELADVVTSCGIVVPPEDPQAMAKAISTLAQDPAMRERLGAAGFLYAQANLEKDTVLKKFEAELLALVN